MIRHDGVWQAWEALHGDSAAPVRTLFKMSNGSHAGVKTLHTHRATHYINELTCAAPDTMRIEGMGCCQLLPGRARVGAPLTGECMIDLSHAA
eukprot:6919307-Pyramimonas_sp.AAC.1